MVALGGKWRGMQDVVNPNQALWEKGDFTAIAASMRSAGRAFVESLGIVPPIRVLDLGCGDGTTAMPLAELGADVVGIDIARNLVDAGNKRAAEAGLDRLTFQHGDACDLHGVADGSFDLTLSMFGAMFAPKPFDVAREMVRVTKPGGRIVMANWIPNDTTSFVSQMLTISMSYAAPPPEGFISPMTWGVEEHVAERFTRAGVSRDRIATERAIFPFTLPDKSPNEFIDTFRRYYGPTMNAFEAAQKAGREQELYDRLVAVARSQNQVDEGVSMSATFMRVTVSL